MLRGGVGAPRVRTWDLQSGELTTSNEESGYDEALRCVGGWCVVGGVRRAWFVTMAAIWWR
jgi:hypothetical protein